MRPGVWRPPVEPSPAEQAVIKAVRRAKLFVFLRQHRHELVEVEAIAAEAGATPTQVALAWLLAKGDVIAPIPGTKRVSRSREHCRR